MSAPKPDPIAAIRRLLEHSAQHYGEGEIWRDAAEAVDGIESMHNALISCSVFFEDAYRILSTKSVDGAMSANTMAAMCNIALARFRGEA